MNGLKFFSELYTDSAVKFVSATFRSLVVAFSGKYLTKPTFYSTDITTDFLPQIFGLDASIS